MAATQAEISDWFDRGVGQQSTHLIVVCDTFAHEDYPVFATDDGDAIAKHAEYAAMEMQRIIEVYDLRMDKASQLNEQRSMHLPAGGSASERHEVTQEAIDTFRAKRLALIQENGFTVQGVFPTKDNQGPPYGYSIGLSAKGLPEVMAMGLPYEATIAILNNVAHQLISGECKGHADELIHKAANMPLKLIELPERVARSYALGAFGYAKDSGATVKLLQVLWPDMRGIYPGTVGCDIAMARVQDANYQLFIRGADDAA